MRSRPRERPPIYREAGERLPALRVSEMGQEVSVRLTSTRDVQAPSHCQHHLSGPWKQQGQLESSGVQEGIRQHTAGELKALLGIKQGWAWMTLGEQGLHTRLILDFRAVLGAQMSSRGQGSGRDARTRATTERKVSSFGFSTGRTMSGWRLH